MEILSNLGFDWQVALANFISFILIFAILKKWVFKPVRNIIERRKKTIQEGIHKAERSDEELKNAQEIAQQTIVDAKAEANSIVADAQQRGDNLVEHAKEKAQDEADAVAMKAQESIEKEKQKVERELLEKTAGLVSLGVQKILEEEVEEDRDKKLTGRALTILKSHH